MGVAVCADLAEAVAGVLLGCPAAEQFQLSAAEGDSHSLVGCRSSVGDHVDLDGAEKGVGELEVLSYMMDEGGSSMDGPNGGSVLEEVLNHEESDISGSYLSHPASTDSPSRIVHHQSQSSLRTGSQGTPAEETSGHETAAEADDEGSTSKPARRLGSLRTVKKRNRSTLSITSRDVRSSVHDRVAASVSERGSPIPPLPKFGASDDTGARKSTTVGGARDILGGDGAFRANLRRKSSSPTSTLPTSAQSSTMYPVMSPSLVNRKVKDSSGIGSSRQRDASRRGGILYREGFAHGRKRSASADDIAYIRGNNHWGRDQDEVLGQF